MLEEGQVIKSKRCLKRVPNLVSTGTSSDAFRKLFSKRDFYQYKQINVKKLIEKNQIQLGSQIFVAVFIKVLLRTPSFRQIFLAPTTDCFKAKLFPGIDGSNKPTQIILNTL